MEKMIKEPEDVEAFLEKVQEILLTEEKVNINSAPWAGDRVNKTRQYMAETGIGKKDILKVIVELGVKNYSSTKKDKNPKFPDEYVWEFGITKNLIDKDEDLYIKLKVRKIREEYLLIMSFHPEQPANIEDKLTFPYAD